MDGFLMSYFMTGVNGDVLADDVWTVTKMEWVDTGEFFWNG